MFNASWNHRVNIGGRDWCGFASGNCCELGSVLKLVKGELFKTTGSHVTSKWGLQGTTVSIVVDEYTPRRPQPCEEPGQQDTVLWHRDQDKGYSPAGRLAGRQLTNVALGMKSPGTCTWLTITLLN